jgi:hypothetical protein
MSRYVVKLQDEKNKQTSCSNISRAQDEIERTERITLTHEWVD